MLLNCCSRYNSETALFLFLILFHIVLNVIQLLSPQGLSSLFLFLLVLVSFGIHDFSTLLLVLHRPEEVLWLGKPREI